MKINKAVLFSLSIMLTIWACSKTNDSPNDSLTVKAEAPSYSPVSGTYNANIVVEIKSATVGATIYYTTNGTVPSSASKEYTDGILVVDHNTRVDIKAIATHADFLDSDISEASFAINYDSVAMPTFDKTPGTFTSDINVTISVATIGATIYFTTDGSTPTTSSTEYSNPIGVAGHGTAITIKAIAVKSLLADSSVMEGTFVINRANVSTTKSTLSTSETGSQDSFDVVLDFQPNGIVIVDVTSADTGEATVDKASLTFTTSNWNLAQTVTVTGVNDILADDSQSVNITLAISTGSTLDTTGYLGVSNKIIVLTNADNETATFVMTSTPVTGIEGGSSQIFTIKLSFEPDANQSVNVVIASQDTGEATVSPSSLSWTELDWNTAKNVTVTPVNDTLYDGDINFNVTIDPSSSVETAYSGLTTINVSVTIQDNEASDNGDGTIKVPTDNLTWMKCGQGQNQLTCSGTESSFQFCSVANNSCNGGIPTGVLNGGGTSGVYTTCNNLNSTPAGGFAGRTNWRVATNTEIPKMITQYNANNSLFPLIGNGWWTATSWNNSSAATQSRCCGGSVSTKTFVSKVRCVSTGL